MTSVATVYQNDTIETTLLTWISTFALDSPHPRSTEQLYSGVSLYEILNKIDIVYWPKSKLQKPNQSHTVTQTQ